MKSQLARFLCTWMAAMFVGGMTAAQQPPKEPAPPVLPPPRVLPPPPPAQMEKPPQPEKPQPEKESASGQHLRSILGGIWQNLTVPKPLAPPRDPFATTEAMAKQAQRFAAVEDIPNMRLKGLAVSGEETVAILEIDASGVLFVREGDTVNVLFRGRPAILKIQRITSHGAKIEVVGSGHSITVR